MYENEYIIPQEFNQSDRIGPFTIPQAFILGAGGLIIMILLSSGMPIWLGALISIPFGILTPYTMFKKINSIPVYEFILVYFTFKSMPKVLIYRMDNMKTDYYDEVEENIIVFDDEEQEIKN